MATGSIISAVVFFSSTVLVVATGSIVSDGGLAEAVAIVWTGSTIAGVDWVVWEEEDEEEEELPDNWDCTLLSCVLIASNCEITALISPFTSSAPNLRLKLNDWAERRITAKQKTMNIVTTIPKMMEVLWIKWWQELGEMDPADFRQTETDIFR